MLQVLGATVTQRPVRAFALDRRAVPGRGDRDRRHCNRPVAAMQHRPNCCSGACWPATGVVYLRLRHPSRQCRWCNPGLSTLAGSWLGDRRGSKTMSSRCFLCLGVFPAPEFAGDVKTTQKGNVLASGMSRGTEALITLLPAYFKKPLKALTTEVLPCGAIPSPLTGLEGSTPTYSSTEMLM